MFTSSTKHDITGCLRDTGVTFGTSFVPEWNSSCIHTLTAYSAFSLTWPASMQIYDTKRNCLHKKRVQLPQDCFGTPTWPPFIVLENQYGRRYVSLRSRRLERTGTGKNGRERARAPRSFLRPLLPSGRLPWRNVKTFYYPKAFSLAPDQIRMRHRPQTTRFSIFDWPLSY